MFSTLEWTKKKDLKYLLKHLFRGGGAIIYQKVNLLISKNIEKRAKLSDQI